MHQEPTVKGGLYICVCIDTLLIHSIIIILWDGVQCCCCCWHNNRPNAICCCCSVIRPRDGGPGLSTCFVYNPWHLSAGRRPERPCLFREQLLMHRFLASFRAGGSQAT